MRAPTTGGGAEEGGYLFCQASAHCVELERSQEQEIDSVKAVHRTSDSSISIWPS